MPPVRLYHASTCPNSGELQFWQVCLIPRTLQGLQPIHLTLDIGSGRNPLIVSALTYANRAGACRSAWLILAAEVATPRARVPGMGPSQGLS